MRADRPTFGFATSEYYLLPRPKVHSASRLYQNRDNDPFLQFRRELTRCGAFARATLSGHPMGPALVERLEKELGRRLRRGKSGRPPKQETDPVQRSFFSMAV